MFHIYNIKPSKKFLRVMFMVKENFKIILIPSGFNCEVFITSFIFTKLYFTDGLLKNQSNFHKFSIIRTIRLK